MTVTTDRVKQAIVGNDSDTQFEYHIPYEDITSVIFYRQDNSVTPYTITTMVQGRDYNIATPVVRNQITINIITGGSSIFPNPPPTTDTIWGRREKAYTQTFYDRQETDPWVPLPTEEAFDRATLQTQQLAEQVDLSLKADSFSGLTGIMLPHPQPLNLIGWNAAGDGLENVPNLQDKVDNNEQAITDLTARVTTNETNIGTNSSNIGTNTSNISTNTANISTNSTNIAGLVTKTDQQRVDINQNATDIANLTDTSAQVAQNTSDIASLISRVTANEAQIAQNVTDINLLQQRVQIIENKEPFTLGFWGRQTLINNQSTPTPIDGGGDTEGMTIDGDEAISARVFIDIHRTTDTNTIVSSVMLVLQYVNATWYAKRAFTTIAEGGYDGVEFTMTTNTQTKVGIVHYTTDDLSGANYTGTIIYRGEKLSNTYIGNP